MFFVRKITWHTHIRVKEPNLSPSDLLTETFYFLLEGGIGCSNEIRNRLTIYWQLEKGGVAFSFRLPQERHCVARKSYIFLLFCNFHCQRMAYFSYDTLVSSRFFSNWVIDLKAELTYIRKSFIEFSHIKGIKLYYTYLLCPDIAIFWKTRLQWTKIRKQALEEKRNGLKPSLFQRQFSNQACSTFLPALAWCIVWYFFDSPWRYKLLNNVMQIKQKINLSLLSKLCYDGFKRYTMLNLIFINCETRIFFFFKITFPAFC